jgi:hypothetical protein
MYSRQFASSLWDQLFSYVVERVFVTIRIGALIRKWSLIFFGIFFWLLIAWRVHPLVMGAELTRNLVYPIQALFAADVVRHILIGAYAFWVAYRIAAVYLDDIFELKNVPLAARFIRQTAFASKYDLIEIKDGKVAPEHRQSPIVLIGGPGMVRVYLENAALFEKIDGTPRVIRPTVRVMGPPEQAKAKRAGLLRRLRRRPWRRPATRRDGGAIAYSDGVEIIDGFERLRRVIDLRDQVVELNVTGRTRDGIRVAAKDVRLVFSVYRDGRVPTLDHPYPFEDESIKNLVYEQPPQNWTKTMEGLIRRELGDFIAKHTLNEFLAAINLQDVEAQRQENIRLQEKADELTGVAGGLPDKSSEQIDLEVPSFVPRPRITDLFYNFAADFTKQARRRGVELHWIGVGTWVTPDDIIPTRHQMAWKITCENLVRGSPSSLHELREESRLLELVKLVKEVPVKAFRELRSKDEDPRAIMRQLAEAYRGKLRAALDLYAREGQGDSEAASEPASEAAAEAASESSSEATYRLRCVLVNMTRSVFHWTGDSNG